MRGLVFNIQKMSIHDGPGIRTTVFLKGCPLKCSWCANPESQSLFEEVAFSVNRCISCGYCAQVCPKGLISSDAPFQIVDRTVCDGCMKCVKECCTEAKRAVGEYYSPESLLEEILKDKVFYDKSGGGATFSGGEPFMQGEFLLEILKLCKENGLHTAVETCGCGNLEEMTEAAQYLDLIFFDLKHMDDAKHREVIGASNKQILRNLDELSRIHSNIVVRTPVIPGINDDPENIRESAEFVASRGIGQYELLPYHDLGKTKYEQMGIVYKLAGLESPATEYMDYLVEKATETVGDRKTIVSRQKKLNEE